MQKEYLNQDFESLAKEVRVRLKRAADELKAADDLVKEKTGHCLGDFAYQGEYHDHPKLEGADDLSEEEYETLDNKLSEANGWLGNEARIVEDMMESVGWNTSSWYC